MKNIFSLIALIIFFLAIPVYAAGDLQVFDSIFNKWTYAFNHKNLAKTCSLFSPSLEANYAGHSRDYATVCAGLKKVFLEKETYKYRYKIHHVFRSHDLAAVRITWYFLQYQQGKLKSITQDEGIDVFKLNQQGQWRIVNYIAYNVPHPNLTIN